MPKAKRHSKFQFEIAFSFAGKHRKFIKDLATVVAKAIDPDIKNRSLGRVFFDEWFQHVITGPRMDIVLQNIYRRKSLMVVADISREYAGRRWPRAEAAAIAELRLNINTAQDETARLRLINIKLGPGRVPGNLVVDGFIDGTKMSAKKCAKIILERHKLLRERMAERQGSIKIKRTSKQPPSNSSSEFVGDHAWLFKKSAANC